MFESSLKEIGFKGEFANGKIFANLAVFDINQKNNLGATPLHIAVTDGNKDAVQILLRNGADLDILTAFDQHCHQLTANSEILACLNTRRNN